MHRKYLLYVSYSHLEYLRTGALLSLVISEAAHLSHLYIAFKQELAFQDHVYLALREVEYVECVV